MSVLTDTLLYAAVALLLVVLFVLGYYMVTNTWPGSRLIISKPPVEHSGIDDDSAKFMFFYTTWCPYCKQAKTPWSSFKEMHKNTKYTYGGKTVVFEDVNAEVDKGKASLYQIKGYPTFKVETKDKVFEMKGTPSTESFREFLKNALGAEKTV
jgi:thiol-disulfide isomerase/thioredoxin